VVQSVEFGYDNTAAFYKEFNTTLMAKLETVFLPEGSPVLHKKPSNPLSKLLLVIPALAGYILHRAFFVQWRRFIKKKSAGTVFFDSVLFGSLIIIYPILVLLITATAVMVSGAPVFWLLFVLIPFTAWCYKQYKSL